MSRQAALLAHQAVVGSSHDGDDRTTCPHCHLLLRGTKPRGKPLSMWVRDNMCDCPPPDEFACACACGRTTTTHVVDTTAKALVPWCGLAQCKRVAAMSYRWPEGWRDEPAVVEVHGCAGCGQQANDGPWARKDEQFAAVSSEYRFLWVDHWCTRGCADIPRLKSVYQNSHKVVLPLDGERPVPIASLAALYLAWALVVPLAVVWWAAQIIFGVFAGFAADRRPRHVLVLVVSAPGLLDLGLLTAALFVALGPFFMAGVSLARLVLGTCNAARSERLWLRLESAYARTHAVLLPSGLVRHLHWRASVEARAREWSTWLWLPIDVLGRTDELWACDVYSVSDRLMVELLGGLAVGRFVKSAVKAGQETGGQRDPSLPLWLPSSLGPLYRPDTLMGRTIEARHMRGAAELTIGGTTHLMVPDSWRMDWIVQLRQDAETGGFVAVRSASVHTFWDHEVAVTCRRLTTVQL